jgi:hypothetical protein
VINDGINDVPDNTFVIFNDFAEKEQTKNILRKPSPRREWFDAHFYRCLPLSIANSYGYVITCEYDFAVIWDGGISIDSLKLLLPPHVKDNAKGLFPLLQSHFGHGILTINPPFFIRTPKGINTMTIHPPNYIIPGVTTMNGVIETDNIRRNFTFNLKVHLPNVQIAIPKGTPIAAFIPIPRYFADNFDMRFADEVFSEEVIMEEFQASEDANTQRQEIELKSTPRVGRDYFRGQDVYGNKFESHQLPKRKK